MLYDTYFLGGGGGGCSTVVPEKSSKCVHVNGALNISICDCCCFSLGQCNRIEQIF